MHCKPVFAMLCAAAFLPAAAFAAGQHPADSARSHPAPEAHANATAGHADAARIEACAGKARAIIDNLAEGDTKAATADFDATMRTSLSAAQLGAVWNQVHDQMGALQGRGAPQNMMYQEHIIIALPLRFENGGVNAQVACDADGKVAGFFLRPAASAAPASSG